MKKTISFLMLGITTAFFGAQAQGNIQQEPATGTTYQQAQNMQEQEKKEIDKAQLPEQVKENFQNSKYSDMQVVAVYEVKDKEAINRKEAEPLDPDDAKRQHMRKTEKINELYAEEEGDHQKESVSPAPQDSAKARAERPNDTIMDKKESQADQMREQRDESQIDQQDHHKNYELEVKGDHKKYILIYSEEGALEQATEESI